MIATQRVKAAAMASSNAWPLKPVWRMPKASRSCSSMISSFTHMFNGCAVHADDNRFCPLLACRVILCLTSTASMAAPMSSSELNGTGFAPARNAVSLVASDLERKCVARKKRGVILTAGNLSVGNLSVERALF